MTTTSFLDEDILKTHKYCLLSIVLPTTEQQQQQYASSDGGEHWRMALKIRGAFDDKAEATRHVSMLQKQDPAHDIWLAECGKWLALPPPRPEAVDDVTYAADPDQFFLNELIQGHRQQQIEARAAFEKRKQQIIEEGLDTNLQQHERILPETAGPSE
jgi:hypothetical protein